ncbi:MAG TPA: hypothetical protein VG916_03590 [Gemmatimonadaceae bacterium]|nr:hypothetical protein [Gemmatimonadaceae bacterium]
MTMPRLNKTLLCSQLQTETGLCPNTIRRFLRGDRVQRTTLLALVRALRGRGQAALIPECFRDLA